MRANHANGGPAGKRQSLEIGLPFAPPVSLVNRFSLKALNAAYFHLGKIGAGKKMVHYHSFFYPLDQLLNWNRVYGPRGFYQYQCVIPPKAREQAVEQLLKETRRSHTGSFLAVLKTFGNRLAPGILSFPQPGVTLALDFPNAGQRTLALMDRMDALVSAAGGRLYAAKDARMPKGMFESGYPGLENFRRFRDPGISSSLSRRLLGS